MDLILFLSLALGWVVMYYVGTYFGAKRAGKTIVHHMTPSERRDLYERMGGNG